MPEQIQKILDKIKEWWNQFNTRQKTTIVSIAAVVIMAFAILIAVTTRPQYTRLANCETTKEASEIIDLLKSDSITYQVSDDGLTIDVLASQLSQANLLLGANNIQAASYSIDNVVDGGFSTTESDKQKKYQLYLAEHLRNDFIKRFESVKEAYVQLSIPDNDGTLISDNKQASVAVALELQGEFTTDNAAFLARAISAAVGNDTTANIVIMDTEGNLLYSGEEEYSMTGNASSQIAVRKQAQEQVASEVKRVLLGTNGFDSIEVASTLDIDFSTSSETDHKYTPADGQSQGLYAESDEYNSESTANSGGVPGTDSNSETSYVIDDNGSESSTVTENKYTYLPNEYIKKTDTPAGKIIYNNSSIGITAVNYIIVKEEEVRDQGLLEGITWDQYKSANSEPVKVEVDEDLINTVAMATGIPASRISLTAYDQNWFMDKEGLGITATDIIQIILIVVILALLAFVVLRSMAGERSQQEEEPELSVETLLQSTPEPELEDIEVEQKSETRKAIEKFVEENPEAAANLLRNWLNEDWG